jgi:hypothetical protein
MRGALAVVTLVVAGCQDLHGVEVIVQPENPAVTSVRLFVGLGDATTTSLTTNANVQVDDAMYWPRDPNNATDVVTGVDGTGEVRFLFDTADAIPAVIAVGYGNDHTPIAAGALTDLELRDGSFTGYELPLIGPVAPLGAQDAQLQLGLWSPPDRAPSAYDAACAGIVVAGADHPYFIVTDQDQDCDGLGNDDMDECTPDAYLGTRPADPSETSCLVMEQGVLGTDQCKLGGATCTDKLPRNENMCVASHTCTPEQLCTLCAMSFDCAADISAQIAMVDHYECVLGRKADDSICQTTFTLQRPPTGGYGCTSAFAIGDANTPLGTQLVVGGVELDATLHDSASSSCAGKLAAKGSSSDPAIDFVGVVSFTLKNNAGFALPIRFAAPATPATSCPATAECALVGALPGPVVPQTWQPAVTACDSAWDPPAAIADLFTAVAGGTEPTSSADQLELIYSANGGDALYRTTRTAIGAMWAPPLPIQFGAFSIPTGSTLRVPKLSPDGMQLFFGMVDPAKTTITMHYTTRSSPTAQWDIPEPVVHSDSTNMITSIAFGPSTHVAIAETDATGNSAIYDATFDAATKTVTPLARWVDAAADPYLTADGLHLYFDATATGGTRLFVASRRTPTEAFASPVELSELSTTGSSDTAPWVPSNARTIYFGSQRTGATVPALFMAQRTSY